MFTSLVLYNIYMFHLGECDKLNLLIPESSVLCNSICFTTNIDLIPGTEAVIDTAQKLVVWFNFKTTHTHTAYTRMYATHAHARTHTHTYTHTHTHTHTLSVTQVNL